MGNSNGFEKATGLFEPRHITGFVEDHPKESALAAAIAATFLTMGAAAPAVAGAGAAAEGAGAAAAAAGAGEVAGDAFLPGALGAEMGAGAGAAGAGAGAGLLGDTVGSDWAAGMAGTGNAGLLGATGMPTGVASGLAGPDMVGSDWASGIQSAQNPGLNADSMFNNAKSPWNSTLSGTDFMKQYAGKALGGYNKAQALSKLAAPPRQVAPVASYQPPHQMQSSGQELQALMQLFSNPAGQARLKQLLGQRG